MWRAAYLLASAISLAFVVYARTRHAFDVEDRLEAIPWMR
jgi:hypothetical protein